MTIQIVRIGNVPNDGLGDQARVAGEKINSNFAELSSSVATKADADAVDALKNRIEDVENNLATIDGGSF